MSNSMKVYSISIVKNEADVIESFVRYHMNILDGMVIIDNGCTDNTPIILEKLKNEGLPIYISRIDDAHYNFDEKMTALLYETFKKYDPDFVFPLDADEFIATPHSNDNPREIINQYDLNTLYLHRHENYYPHESDHTHELFIPKRFSYRHKQERITDFYSAHKVAISKNVMKFFPHLRMGNHGVDFHLESVRNVSVQSINRVYSNELVLSHFSLRSSELVKSKALVGWISNLTRYNRTGIENYHWLDLYNKLKENLNAPLDDVIGKKTLELAPMNLSFCNNIEIKYTNANEVNAIKNLLEYCEKLALDYAALKRDLLQYKQ
jgi:glycosyltransferase involved in cell wall biosynthesis